MKSFIKIIALVGIIGITSFTVLNTQAANVHNHNALIHQQNNVVIFFTLPQISGGGKVVYSNNLISTVTEYTPHFEKTHEDSCPNKKGNEVYELTALFNDKLQMLLSFFAAPKNQDDMKEIIKDKDSIQVVSTSQR